MRLVTTNSSRAPALNAATLALCAALTACGDSDVSEREEPREHDAFFAPEGFTIEQIISGGSGCPDPAAISIELSPDYKHLRLVYHDMVLENPPGPAVKIRNCQVALQFRIPAGWQVAPAAMYTRGFAYLDAGLTARQTSTYKFAGDPFGAQANVLLTGPYDDAYTNLTWVPYGDSLWSDCGQSTILAINATLQLNATGDPAGLALVDVSSQRLLYWRWRQC